MASRVLNPGITPAVAARLAFIIITRKVAGASLGTSSKWRELPGRLLPEPVPIETENDRRVPNYSLIMPRRRAVVTA
jgi:hypothetical protein